MNNNSYIFLISFISLFLLSSCAIEKRLYRHGFYSEHSGVVFHHDHSGAPEMNSFNKHACEKCLQHDRFPLHEMNPVDKPVIDNDSLLSMPANGVRSAKVIAVNKEPTGEISGLLRNKHSLQKNTPAYKHDSDFGGILIILLEFALIFLLGLGIQALFPALALWVAVLIAIPAFYIIIVAIYLVVMMVAPSPC